MILSSRDFDLSKIDQMSTAFDLTIIAIIWGYNIFFVRKCDATPGKKVFNLQVVSASNSLKTSSIVVREMIGKILSSLIFSMGYIWVAFDSKKQGWHDKIAETYVVYTESLGTGKKILAAIFVLLIPRNIG